jgi:hypothetical protein
MKTATPTLIGAEINIASKDEYSVPQMNGSAPKSPVTGFQFFVRQKLRPNSRIVGSDW